MDRIRSKVSTGFKAPKCKTSLKMAMARIKLLKNKREVQVRQMRRDLAQLLESGQDQTARIRVEHAIREEKTMSAYELIEIYCELIVARLSIIESQKGCPIDLKEAIAGIVFASPRCADIPELMDARKQFAAKYGKEFTTSALEVRPDCGVSRMLVEKLSARAPDSEEKIKTLTAIAQEHNVKWDSKDLEEQFHKPNADLLNGPSTFGSASRMPIEHSSVSHSFATDHNDTTTVNSALNSVVSKQTIVNAVPPVDGSSQSKSVAPTPPYVSRPPGSSSGGDVRISSSREDNASSGQPVWNMEFKDATSAAQAAAESAERASMAARAAVELATRESMSRQSSIESHESSSYISQRRESEKRTPTGSHESSSFGIRHNKPVKRMSSSAEDVASVQEFVNENVLGRSQGTNMDNQNMQRDDVGQSRESDNIHRNSSSLRNEPISSSSSQSRGNISGQSSTGPYALRHNRSAESMPSKQDTVDYFEEHVTDEDELQRDEVGNRRETEGIYYDHESPRSRSLSRSTSGSSGISDTSPEMNFPKADTKEYDHAQRYFSETESASQDLRNPENESADLGRWNTEEQYNKSTSPHFAQSVFNADVLWDSTIRKTDTDSGYDSRHGSGEGLLGVDKKQPTISHDSGAVFDDSESDTDDVNLLDSFLPNQREPSSFPSNVDIFSPEEPRSESIFNSSGSKLDFIPELHSGNHSGTRENEFPSSYSDKNMVTSLDYSDRTSSETAGELPDSPIFSRGYKKKLDQVEILADKNWEEPDASVLPNKQPSWRNNRYMESINADGVKYDHSNEESHHWRSSKGAATSETEKMENYDMPYSHSNAIDTDNSDEFKFENDQSLNLRRLPGGLKNKGFQRPPYVKSPMVKASVLPHQTFNESPSIVDKVGVSDLDNSYASLEVQDERRYDRKSLVKDYTSNSRPSRTNVEADFDKDKQSASHRTSARSGYRGKASSSSEIATEVTDAINRVPVVPNQGNMELDDQTPRRKASGKLSSKDPLTYSASGEESLEFDKPQSVDHRARKDVKLSWRTRNSTSDSTENSHLRSRGRSDGPVNYEKETKPSRSSSASKTPSNTTSHSANLEVKESTIPLQAKLSTEQPPVAQTESVISADRGDSNTSKNDSSEPSSEAPKASTLTEGSISRESSLNNAPHVHPKLPDYDSFAAHFQALRANRR